MPSHLHATATFIVMDIDTQAETGVAYRSSATVYTATPSVLVDRELHAPYPCCNRWSPHWWYDFFFFLILLVSSSSRSGRAPSRPPQQHMTTMSNSNSTIIRISASGSRHPPSSSSTRPRQQQRLSASSRDYNTTTAVEGAANFNLDAEESLHNVLPLLGVESQRQAEA